MLKEGVARSSSSGVLSFVKRLFSYQKGSSLPEGVLTALAGAPFEVHKLPGQGRGLVANRDVQQGDVLLTEQPFVCCPAFSNRKKVCYHCLKVLPTAQQQAAAAASAELPISTRSHVFCSQSCLSRAQNLYYILESQASLQQLEHYCSVHEERFPLMAARLALMIAQEGMLGTSSSQPPASPAAAGGGAGGPADMGRTSRISKMSTNSTASTSRWSSTNLGTISSRSNMSLQASSWESSGSRRSRSVQLGRADMLSAKSSAGAASAHSSGATPLSPGSSMQQQVAAALGFLSFANIPPPPPAPWQEAHKMIVRALQTAAANREQEDEAMGLASAVRLIDLDWYVAVMARLHINTFKVQSVMQIDWSQGHAAAAAMLGGDASAGSALYLLASMFNHSCEPNVLVTFPQNDSTAVFIAARHIAAGEQLYISYIDEEQEVDIRQEFLAFSYGFKCQCVKCQDELAEAAKHMPPQLP